MDKNNPKYSFRYGFFMGTICIGRNGKLSGYDIDVLNLINQKQVLISIYKLENGMIWLKKQKIKK